MYCISKTKVKVAELVFKFVQKPTPVCYIGAGKINKAAEILEMNSVKRVLIITDAFLLKLGLLDSMLEKIKGKNIQAFIYDGVKPDPTFTIADEALKMCKDNNCEAVVAVGGGSVLDTAKVISVAVTNNKTPKELEGMLKAKKKGIPFIAVPTTAGTGSETTLAAVISDPVSHKKTTIVDPNIIPLCAILDPEVTVGLPPHITAHTAMDALTHALEAYVSKYATDETNRYASIAIKLIYENLEKVYQNPKDLDGREALLVASFYAGLAFTRTYVGYVHAFAHNIGGKFGVPHGLANAVLLPHIMEYYKPACQKQFAQLCDLVGMGKSGNSQSEKANLFVDSIFKLNNTLGIPARFEKFVSTEVAAIQVAGFKECHGTYPVPKYLTATEAQKILQKVCAEE